MRKWMRERLQRRRKKASEQASELTPPSPPLQPAYFDSEEVASPAPNGSHGELAEDSSGSQVAEAPPTHEEPTAAFTEQHQKQPTSTPRRGRRRRGGRGRGGRGREQAVAQAFAPGKGSAATEPAASIAAESAAPGAEVAEAAEPRAETPLPAAPPAQVPVSSSRPPKGIVVLAIGLPGSGKSSWFKRHNVVPLSSDMMRSLLFDDVREQRYQDLVFSNLRSMLKARLIAKRPMNYVDATNLTPQERQPWIKLAKDYNYEVHAVFFDVSLEVCIDRHQRRDRVVPEDAMRRMAAKLKPPSFQEGFAKITVVRVKKKDQEPAEP
jgi:predicted kinase